MRYIEIWIKLRKSRAHNIISVDIVQLFYILLNYAQVWRSCCNNSFIVRANKINRNIRFHTFQKSVDILETLSGYVKFWFIFQPFVVSDIMDFNNFARGQFGKSILDFDNFLDIAFRSLYVYMVGERWHSGRDPRPYILCLPQTYLRLWVQFLSSPLCWVTT